MASPAPEPSRSKLTPSYCNEEIAVPKPGDHWSFTSILADILQLPDETIAMCFIYMNRFAKYARTATDTPKLDPHTLSLASLSLATKTTESPRRLRALIIPAHRLLHAHKSSYKPLAVSSPIYDALRSTIIHAELLLLRILRFDAHIPLPLDFLPRYLDRTVGELITAETDFDAWEPREREEVKVVGFMETRVARAAREECVAACKNYRLANLFPARTVAVAVLWVTLKSRGLDAGKNGRAWVDEVAGEKVDARDFEEAVAVLERTDV